MPQAMWTGSVSFGLVAVPVRMVSAVRSSSRTFHLLHAPDNARVQRRMVCQAEGVFVHPEHMLRGFEVDGKLVTVTEGELQALAPRRSKTIEILDFVELDAIDPVHYARPYYLLPDGVEKPYRLLVETLEEKRRAGVAKFVLHHREYLTAVRSLSGVLCLVILRYVDEIRPDDDVALKAASARSKKVQAMAKVIEAMSEDFRPDQIEDEQHRRLEQFVQEKRRRHEVVTTPEQDEG